jgi:hypothetical protein
MKLVIENVYIYNIYCVRERMYGQTHKQLMTSQRSINPLNAELNPICHLLALLGAHHILHVSGIRVKEDFPMT